MAMDRGHQLDLRPAHSGDAEAPAVIAPDFNACVAALGYETLVPDITRETFDQILAGVEPDHGVIRAMQGSQVQVQHAHSGLSRGPS